MPIGAGAIGNLTQYIPYRAENPGDAFNRGQQVGLQRQQNEWYRGQREKEFQQEQEQDDRSWRMDRAKFGLDQEKFAYDQQQKQRALKAQAYDELMDAYLTNDPEQIRAAAQKARLAGIDVPGLEEPQGATPQGAPQAKGEAPPPERTQTPAPVPAPQEKTLKSVTEGAAPKPGEDIGDGWEVVETPPEAQQEGPAPWLTKEMQGRGEAPTEQPGNAPAPWLTNELESRGDISFQQAEAARYRAQPPAGIPQAIMEMGGLPARVAPSGGGAAPRGRAGAYPRTAELRGEEMGPMELDTRPYRPSEDTGGVRTADLKDSDRTGYEGVEGLQRFEDERQGRRYNTATESAPGVPIGGLPGGQPAPQPQGPKGYQIVDRDTGEVIGQLNPEAALSRAQKRVSETFDPLIEQQTSSEGKRAAAIAKDTAVRLVGTQGYSVRDAIEAGQKRYDKEMGNATAKSVARGGKDEGEGLPGGNYGGGFTEGTEIGNDEFKLHDRAEKMGKDVSMLHSVRNVNQSLALGGQLLSQIKSGNTVSKNEVITNLIKMTQGAKSTDADREFFLSSSGKLDQYEMMFRRWASSGTLPPNFEKNIEAYVSLLQAHNMELKAAIWEKAYSRAMETVLFAGLPPELQEQFARQVANAAVGEGGGGRLRGEKTRSAIKAREKGQKKEKVSDEEFEGVMEGLD